MANTRRRLNPYMGFDIYVINGYRYRAYDGELSLESTCLEGLKKKIRNERRMER